MSQINEHGSKTYLFIATFIAAIGGFLFGYDLMIIAGAQLFLKSEFGLTEAQWGFANSSAVLGCVTGPLLGGWLCDAIGRKLSLYIACVLFAISAIITALAQDITVFNIFRFVGGMGVGLSSVASPLYIAEIAPAKFRGRLGLLYQLTIVIGCVVAVIVSWLLAKYLNEHISWRWMFASEMVAILLFSAFIIFIPPSPRWLAEKGRDRQAMNVLTRINGSILAQKEWAGIQDVLTEESGTFSEIFRPGMRMALFIGCMLGFFANWTGWGAIAIYVPVLFQKAGFADKSNAIFQAIYVNGFVVLVVIAAMFLVDRAGRRWLWNISSAGMIASLIAMGLIFHFKVTGVIVLLVLFLIAGGYNLSFGPLSWLMMSEIFPNRIRAKAVAVTTTINWIFIFFGALLFPILSKLSEQVTGSLLGLFCLYAGVCLYALIFGIWILPETKGKSLEEISKRWLHSSDNNQSWKG